MERAVKALHKSFGLGRQEKDDGARNVAQVTSLIAPYLREP
jgi:hypothetical protein